MLYSQWRGDGVIRPNPKVQLWRDEETDEVKARFETDNGIAFFSKPLNAYDLKRLSLQVNRLLPKKKRWWQR